MVFALAHQMELLRIGITPLKPVHKPEQIVKNSALLMKTVLLTSIIQVKDSIGVSVGLNKRVMDTWED
jgi:hypothetical protein